MTRISNSLTRHFSVALKAAAMAACVGLILTGCSRADTGTAIEAGVSVPVGADAETYQEALQDMAPVTLVAQPLTSVATNWVAEQFDRFVERVDEYSGGKIQIEANYGYTIAPVLEANRAIADGRIDMGGFLPLYLPAELPANSWAWSSLSTYLPTGPIEQQVVTATALAEVAWEFPGFVTELESEDVVVLNPMSMVQGPNGLACREPLQSLDDFSGRIIGAGGELQLAQLKALGAEVVSMPYTELYEGLQRGTVDCSAQSWSAAVNNGILEVAPFLITPVESGFVGGNESFVFNKRQWEQLPLAAQQLLFDLVTEGEAERVAMMLDSVVARTVTTAEGFGGRLVRPDQDVEDALLAFRDGLRTQWESDPLFGPDFTEIIDASFEKWSKQTASAGYEDSVEISMVAADSDFGISTEALTEMITAIRAPYRPE